MDLRRPYYRAIAWAEDLCLAGVVTYKAERDVPYKEDRSKGPPSTGGYGTVSRATRSSGIPLISEQQVYASKRIEIKSLEHQKEVAQEIKFLRQCQHRNIVQLEEAYIINHPNWANNVYLVTKPWAQLSFQQFVLNLARNRGNSTLCPWFRPQTLDPWPSIVRQCLSGLAYLHSEHPGSGPIRHKDIKPDNIVFHSEFDSSGKLEVRAIIIDLGISKEHIHGATTANKGSYQYVAPEQIENEDSKVKSKNPTLASDVFSLGCCFALVESILRPWPSLKDVYHAGLETGDCRFANHVDSVNDMLQDQDVESVGPGGPGLEFFRSKFRGLVHDMLEKEPGCRPSASQALDNINRIDSDLARFLDNPTLELCITLRGKATILVEVDLSRFKSNGSLMQELNRRYRDAAGRGHWRLAVPLHKAFALHYVKFAIHDTDCPTVRSTHRIETRVAPLQDPESDASLYSSRPTPSYLTHLMWAFGSDRNIVNHQDQYHETDVIDRIPRTFGQSSMNEWVDKRRPVYGRGLEITEELDWRMCFFIACFWVVVGFVIGIVQSIRTKDIQGALALSSYCITLGGIPIFFLYGDMDRKTDRR